MLLNSSNIQTVALGCLLLSVIICIFTWYWSQGSNAHSQQQTAFIYRHMCRVPQTPFGAKSIKLNTQCQAVADLALWRLCLAGSWPHPCSPAMPAWTVPQWKWFQALPARAQLPMTVPKSWVIWHKARNGKCTLNKVWCFWERLKSTWTHPGKQEYSP